MVGSTSSHDPYNIAVEKRRSRSLDLRLQGLTFRDIYLVIKQEFPNACPPSYSERHAWNDVDFMLRQQAKHTSETAEQVLQLELGRLDQLLAMCMSKALGGDMKAVDRVLYIMQRRAKYLGLDKPQTYIVNTWQNEIIQLIKQGKLTIGQVRQELGDELTQRLLESGSVSIPQSGAVEDQGDVLDGEFVAAAEHSGREQQASAVSQSAEPDLG